MAARPPVTWTPRLLLTLASVVARLAFALALLVSLVWLLHSHVNDVAAIVVGILGATFYASFAAVLILARRRARRRPTNAL